MVGMQHEDRTQKLDRREILVRIDDAAPSTSRQKASIGAISRSSRLTPMPLGNERPKSAAFIQGAFVRFMAMGGLVGRQISWRRAQKT